MVAPWRGLRRISTIALPGGLTIIEMAINCDGNDWDGNDCDGNDNELRKHIFLTELK